MMGGKSFFNLSKKSHGCGKGVRGGLDIQFKDTGGVGREGFRAGRLFLPSGRLVNSGQQSRG